MHLSQGEKGEFFLCWIFKMLSHIIVVDDGETDEIDEMECVSICKRKWGREEDSEINLREGKFKIKLR